MGTLTFANRTCAAIAFICALLTLTGCGSGESQAVAEGPQVDPQFVSAESLTAYFNSLNTRLPRDLPKIVPLYHIENDFQRKRWEVLNRESQSAHHDLEVAVYERFNESLLPYRVKPRACTPAVLTKIGEQRAEGTYKDWRGIERPLHLIFIQSRWWISGYTIEYETDTDKRDFIEGMSDAMLTWDSNDEYLRPIVARVRAGEFQTIERVRDAVSQALRHELESKFGERE